MKTPETDWHATHVIELADGAEIEVMLLGDDPPGAMSGGPLMTRVEWQLMTVSDFGWNNDGTLHRNGELVEGSVRRIPS